MAAVSLGRSRGVLCLIGGGVFRNRARAILAAIDWALTRVEPLAGGTLDVVLNGLNLGRMLDLKREVLPMVRARDGAVMRFDHGGIGAGDAVT